jgi:glycosyltransferase involved in cell wall biosynthesis/SAM-dependent methyltransferase
MTPRYLYVSPDLRKTAVIETDALDATTERQRLDLAEPRLRPAVGSVADQAARDGIQGVVFRLASGLPSSGQLEVMGAVLNGGGRRLWLHWSSERAIECVDEERFRSLRRHRAFVSLMTVLQPILRRVGSLRRLPRALKWAYRGSFPVDRPGILDRLHELYDIAHPVPFADSLWIGERVAGDGLYVRTDYWNQITSGGSYGHTCYVAKELSRTSRSLTALLPHAYPLLDTLGVRQVVMDQPSRTDNEDAMIDATTHYYRIVKAACQVIHPAYIYERLCLGNYAAAMISRELQIPFIAEYNGSEISIQRSFDGAAPHAYSDIHLAAEAFAFRQATVISVVSELVKDDLVERGVDAAKILVNPNGADVEAYAPPSDAEKCTIRRELGFEPAHRVVGFTATFGGWHGVDVLAGAIPRICAASPDVRFLVIGDGTYKPQLDEVVSGHDLEDRVCSVGRVPQGEGARLLKACDIYVAPHNAHMVDRRFFGSPTKLFEYMAMEGAVVASDLEQIGEVLSPALSPAALVRPDLTVGCQRAVLCTPGDVDDLVEAVIRLAARPDVCRALGRNSRQAVIDHYSWTRHVEKLWAFARARRGSAPPALATGEAYKDETQKQWNGTPVGSERAKTTQPHTLAWFREIEADRHGSYAPWMPGVMEFDSHGGERVLEIGGGLGIDLAQFASHGATVTDVDLSSRHLALAEEHFRLRGLDGSFLHHDGEQLPLPDDAFDLVYSNGVLHHTPNAFLMIEEMYRVLRPGGRIIVMVYAENSLHYWRRIVYARGVKEGQLDGSSVGAILSRSVENAGTDARPLVKVYTRARLGRMFGRFSDVTVLQRQLCPEELPRPVRPLRAAIERFAGWNLIVKGNKPR